MPSVPNTKWKGNNEPRKKYMSGELQPEYDFDYCRAKPNRFAIELPPGGRIVYLEPDVAAVFTDSDQVNRLLKAVLAALRPTPTARNPGQ